MTIRIGINGFGRIGRLAVRGIASHDGIELAHINDLKADAVTADPPRVRHGPRPLCR